MKTLLCCWIANHLETQARTQRRALRDYHRLETARVSALERRSRGLRLYAAWARRPSPKKHSESAESWPLPQAAWES